ncbi:MAG TPA: DNA polymerase III subunit gamma/tau [Solirubrobacteraceae bacterium]|nr:DNA polymerase III subunit gamma/tau [Solirubrobacteraceae bacterium]
MAEIETQQGPPESGVQSSEPSQRSLYRRHRPRSFADVVGQDAVVRTLRNAVEGGRVHHAYLFVGSRGTGKTSMAKILAACLNCERGPTIEPCGECESCRAIAAARSLDVIEMDAASNNSVDDIRELRESVAFAPVSGRSKVYILDEAHMLSTAAWNAFLKTLEEPPPNTVFVLATTEAQKVPATVVDRCHRFDFQRPTVEQIADVVRRAAAAEAIAIPPEAVAALARAATGSFRDALGLLEQLVTYSGREIALEDVLAVLGATDSELLEETIDAVHAGDARAALLAVARCAQSGRDAGAFAADLEVRARELLVVATLGEVPAELALTPEIDTRLAAQAARVGEGVAVRLLEQLAAALEAVKAGADPRTQLELALVKAARPAVDGSLGALLTRIERLERGGAPSPERGPSQPVEVPPAVAPTPAAPPRAREDESAPVAARPREDAGASAVAPAPPPAQAAESAPPLPPAPEPPAPEPPAPEPPAISTPVTPAPAVAALDVSDLDALVALWPAVLELVGAENKLLSAVLAHAQPVAVRDGELLVAFAATASFPKKKAEDREHRATVTRALRELTGDAHIRVEYELRDELPAAAGEPEPAPRTEEEWVARFKDELDAEELPTERVLAGGAGESPTDTEIQTASGE